MPVGPPPAIYYSKTEKKQLKQPDKFINKLTLPQKRYRVTFPPKKNKPSSKKHSFRNIFVIAMAAIMLRPKQLDYINLSFLNFWNKYCINIFVRCTNNKNTKIIKIETDALTIPF